jgi:hypothetical protein
MVGVANISILATYLLTIIKLALLTSSLAGDLCRLTDHGIDEFTNPVGIEDI